MLAAATLTFCRVAIATVFALSAGGKALNISAFEESVSKFALLPSGWSKPVALLFVSAEAAIALSMLGQRTLLFAGFLLAAALLAVFSIALSIALRRDSRMSCNCFGRTERRISRYDVARNALFFVCSLAGMWALSDAREVLSVSQLILIALMAACFVVFAVNLRDAAKTLWEPFQVG